MDVTSTDFAEQVVEASKELPVVVDFWAPWCGPCRTLGPIIEKIASEFVDRIKLVKVNSDDCSDISAALDIRSIPTVIAFRGGRPVAQFIGALPESAVRDFFEKLLPSVAEQILGRAEQLLADGRPDEAEQSLEEMPRDPSLDARAQALRHGIAFARAGAEGPREDTLRARLEADRDDHDARLTLAAVLAGQQRYAAAMDELLELVRRANNWQDGEGRKRLLALFSLAAEDPKLVAEYRRKLATALH